MIEKHKQLNEKAIKMRYDSYEQEDISNKIAFISKNSFDLAKMEKFKKDT